MKKQAQTIIQKFGGVSRLARLLKCDRTTIYKWLYPKEKRGTGGLIPTSRLSDILFIADMEGIVITAEDLYS